MIDVNNVRKDFPILSRTVNGNPLVYFDFGGGMKRDKKTYPGNSENPKKIKAPYMVMGFHTKDRAHKELASAIHSYDFTARPQLLEKEYNPSYYDLINNFEKHTGIPALLNTSFNLHWCPIVCTPTDAINTLKKTRLKHLAIGNYLISKK